MIMLNYPYDMGCVHGWQDLLGLHWGYKLHVVSAAGHRASFKRIERFFDSLEIPNGILNDPAYEAL